MHPIPMCACMYACMLAGMYGCMHMLGAGAGGEVGCQVLSIQPLQTLNPKPFHKHKTNLPKPKQQQFLNLAYPDPALKSVEPIRARNLQPHIQGTTRASALGPVSSSLYLKDLNTKISSEPGALITPRHWLEWSRRQKVSWARLPDRTVQTAQLAEFGSF